MNDTRLDTLTFDILELSKIEPQRLRVVFIQTKEKLRAAFDEQTPNNIFIGEVRVFNNSDVATSRIEIKVTDLLTGYSINLGRVQGIKRLREFTSIDLQQADLKLCKEARRIVIRNYLFERVI
jgi:hypothetical protein